MLDVGCWMFCPRLCCAALLLTVTLTAFAADDYPPGPDSQPQPGVPKGEVTKYQFNESKIFPGTTRDYWVYVFYSSPPDAGPGRSDEQ